MKKIVNYVGLWIEKDVSNPYTYNINDYKTIDEKKIKAHKGLLKALEKKEDDRLTIIDSKTSQIVTYTGIIFSALSLFIPILLDKISDHSLFARIIFIIVLVFAFLFYVLTIHNAIRNYNIGKFHYSRSDPNNVIKYQDKSESEFTNIEIKDLLYSYNQNSKTNDEKANNLIYAYRAFRIANAMTAIIGALICSSLLFAKPKEEDINIKNPIQIQNFDSTAKAIIKTIKEQNNFNKFDTTQQQDSLKHYLQH
ncbi:MAG TPA: hypothetical protein VE978_03995 [Chitinophagales bacterium]|nr:hypothetical protein [Chitinophagales bacterium]